jgi:hypothetical protein
LSQYILFRNLNNDILIPETIAIVTNVTTKMFKSIFLLIINMHKMLIQYLLSVD